MRVSSSSRLPNQARPTRLRAPIIDQSQMVIDFRPRFNIFPRTTDDGNLPRKKLKFLMQQAALYDLLMGQFGKGRNSGYYYG